MAEPQHEIDRLDPEPNRLVLSGGLEVEVLRLRTRQFFRLLRILTHGAGPAILRTTLQYNPDDDSAEEFAQQLIMVVVSAVPDAEQETMDFLSSMVRPVGIADKPDSQLSKQERESNDSLWTELAKAMWNPEPEDTLTIISEVINQEASDLMALGKKAGAMLEMARKTGQAKQETPQPPPTPRELASAGEMVVEASPARSRKRSTYSPPSMDGPTSTSPA